MQYAPEQIGVVPPTVEYRFARTGECDRALAKCNSHSSCVMLRTRRVPSRLLRSIVVTARDQNDARACNGTQLVRADVVGSTPCHCSLVPVACSCQGTRGYHREARTFWRSRRRGVGGALGARLLESRCGMPRFAGSSLSSAAAPDSARESSLHVPRHGAIIVTASTHRPPHGLASSYP